MIRDRPWGTTTRIPTTDGPVWFKACGRSRLFEAELVAALARGWPDLLPRVLACDIARGWLLTADAGAPFDHLGNPPELWLQLLPRYAELQREATVPAAVPDRTLGRWPELYDELAGSELPLAADELERVRAYAPRFAALCDELAAFGLRPAVQHDDLHHKNAFVDGEALRIVDWGDASLSHPFVSLTVPFRFLEERNGLLAHDPWFEKLRDAYLEPWGSGLVAGLRARGTARPVCARFRVGLAAQAAAGGSAGCVRRALPGRAPARSRPRPRAVIVAATVRALSATVLRPEAP